MHCRHLALLGLGQPALHLHFGCIDSTMWLLAMVPSLPAQAGTGQPKGPYARHAHDQAQPCPGS